MILSIILSKPKANLVSLPRSKDDLLSPFLLKLDYAVTLSLDRTIIQYPPMVPQLLTLEVDTAAVAISSQQLILSLGTGSMSPEGLVEFSASPVAKARQSPNSRIKPKMTTVSENPSFKFRRSSSSFLRVADLEIDANNTSITTQGSEESHPNYHHPACDPPPGVELDPKEQWIALNDCDGLHAPIAPVAIERLADFGLTTSMNDSMWTPDSKTDRLLQRAQCPRWMKSTFKPGCVKVPDSATTPTGSDVLVWSGSFRHGLYGSDLPAIRAAGIVNMPAKALVEILVDSGRVKEYNKMSLGRTDLQVFQNDMSRDGPFGKSITKVMKSENKPPMVRKNLVFVSILHAKELIDGSGYLIVTRAVHHPDEQEISSSIQSEILMGVNLIRKIEGEEDQRCLMINVNHIRSPMVPMMIAKRIGVSAAIGFINDIRTLC